MSNKFDPFSNLGGGLVDSFDAVKLSWKLGKHLKAKAARRKVEGQYGHEVADAVEAAVRDGRNPGPIIERAKRDLEAKEERARQLANPPPLHGSARWPNAADLQPYLRSPQAFHHPRSLYLGSFQDDETSEAANHVHWNGDGHLLTIAPTRTGKALTTIIPNLLRYKGSCVVLDPKGELFEASSKERSKLGPVYRIAPMDRGSGKPVHRFDPLSRVKREADARAIALQMFPRDSKVSAFFSDDAAGFMTAVLMYVRYQAPPGYRSLATACEMAMLKGRELLEAARRMAAFPPSADGGRALLEKDPERSLKTLQETLTSKLYEWRDRDLLRSVEASDVDFESLKDRTATVYIEIPFDKMKTFSGWLRVVLKSALDAMLANPRVPDIPVLFVLDEFLNMGAFPEYRDAIRTHAGAGVRLWFFMQDLYSLEEHYPGNSWRPFLNCGVKQFFGVNDHETAKLIADTLGSKTLAFETNSANASVSSHLGGWETASSTNTGVSSNEGIQFMGRPLLTPDEIRELLGAWQGDGWRYGITEIAGVRPFKTRLAVYEHLADCKSRIGMVTKGEHDDRHADRTSQT